MFVESVAQLLTLLGPDFRSLSGVEKSSVVGFERTAEIISSICILKINLEMFWTSKGKNSTHDYRKLLQDC